MSRPWAFAQRMGAGFVASLVVALVLAGAAVGALLTVRASHKARILDLSNDVLEVERLHRAFSEKVASGRGLALSGDAQFQRDMTIARQRFQVLQERLRPRLADEPAATLLSSAVRAEQEHEDAAQALGAANDAGASRDQLDALFHERVGRARERTEQALQRLTTHASERLSRGIRDAMEADRQALALMLVAAVLGTAAAAMLAWVLMRRLAPLRREAASTARRFQLLVESVRDYAICLLDAQGRVASWNPGAARITGWREEEVLGRPVAMFYPQKAVAEGRPERDLERAERDGRLRGEAARLRKDGTLFWGEVVLVALRDEEGRMQGFALLVRDITERRRAERMQRLLAVAGKVFQQATDPDLMVAELTRMMVPEVAEGCILFLLTPSGQLVPRAVAHARPESQEALWEAARRYPSREDAAHGVWRVLRSGRSELVPEVPPETLDRSAESPEHRSLLCAAGIGSYLAVPLRVEERTRGVFVLLSEPAGRRFTPEDQVLVEELAGRAALALDNARLLREAQQALELIGVTAHDLGNPLHALQLLLRRLQRVDAQESPERMRVGLAAALKQAQRLGQLLHNLLDLSRLSSGKLVLDVAPVDLADVAHECMERFSAQAAEAGSRLELSAELGLVGRWDRPRLDRLVTNLLSNALKFGRGKPILLSVERAGGAWARLSVKDHGLGIAEDAQRRIFERFEREPSAGRNTGFGLGLYIVRQLVEAHGGTVRVESTLGEGATFIVELPLPRAGVDAELPAPH
ncbi:PAS domain S-box protein [Myxococcaceae bacterium JPH2]|nr:PAS domain S-box protein [Myxococcaceae bacterium JPH2]